MSRASIELTDDESDEATGSTSTGESDSRGMNKDEDDALNCMIDGILERQE